MVATSILLVINKVCGYLDNIRYVDIISVAYKDLEGTASLSLKHFRIIKVFQDISGP